ncbi:MAG: hypothetical protein CMC76_06745 [Flavobacteriaceae bacterium]|uniref:hypothetical protein n=1 Tax=Winogradskyella sp. SYSU M77433 TaxID=3042722 RepID=UPI000C3EE698|nr:hypothetical protein [Winogradskyella sp. SYSU M77433]MAX70788.1 hypothetical protein [Flavobacteriaceae bacterium]MDH7912834.1 hypothetical protein [Winogradskyella sp. SYSU M77433]|tara:strand:- start:116 stop:319 length:204 start_codon:yes stop_codon:yes gene_type:complete
MIAIGTTVKWGRKESPDVGIVKDYYKFVSKEYALKHQRAILIETLNHKHVLKLESQVDPLPPKNILD